jgi:hypothetical protein
MPLPDNFSEWKHLQSTLLIYHNKMVRDEFSDITADDDIAIPRGSLKIACLLKDSDTVSMTILRLYLLFFHARKAQDLQAPIYGVPVGDVNERMAHKPQVQLLFQQDDDSVPQKKHSSRAEIHFRLVNETSQTLTESDLDTLARRIKAEFGTDNGYRWRKGHLLVTYKSPSEGLSLQLYAYNESEAREVIEKVCNAAQKTFDNNYIVVHESKQNFPTNPGTQVILGKDRDNYLKRPVVYVRFRRATLAVSGLPNPITLVSRRWDAKESKEWF